MDLEMKLDYTLVINTILVHCGSAEKGGRTVTQHRRKGWGDGFGTLRVPEFNFT